MALNVTTAVFRPGFNIATASPSLVQWDQGQTLQFEGVELPSAYQVEFTNAVTVQAITMIGNENGVEIPNELLQQSFPINAYIVLHETAEDRETEYWATIYVKARQKPREETPDPEQSSVIDQTIAALQEGVAEAQAASQAVQNMGVEAETLPEGSQATVEKTVDPDTGAVTLGFGIPEGRHGATGATPDIQIGTVTTGAPGSQAAASITGTREEPRLNLTIPQGPQGDAGVTSVNGKTGAVTLDAADVGAKPASYEAPVSSVNGKTGAVVLDASDVGAKPASYEAPVSSVNGKTGAVVLSASDVGAKPASYEAPVSSVNEKTGAVVLDSEDIRYDSTETYSDGTVGKELGTINSALSSLSAVTEIIDTASGAIASFPDGSGLPMRSLLAQINPVQDLHEYDAPWPAGGGVNKLPPMPDGTETMNNMTVVATGGKLTVSGTTSGGSFLKNYTLTATHEIQSDEYLHCGNSFGSGSAVVAITFSDSTSYEVTISAINRIVSLSTYVGKVVTGIRFYCANNIAFNGTIAPMIASSSTAVTWSPYSNICPISGWTGLQGQRTGKNLLSDSDIRVGKNYNGVDNALRSMIYLDLPLGTYTVGVQNKSSFAEINIGTSNMVFGDTYQMHGIASTSEMSWSVTTTEQHPLVCVFLRNASETMTLDQIHSAQFQVETGSTASDFEAYQGNSYSVSWQDEAGTVYGGQDEIVEGNLTSTMGMVDMGDLDWTIPTGCTHTFACLTLPKKYPSDNMICSMYPVSGLRSTDANMPTLEQNYDKVLTTSTGSNRITVIDSAYTDVTAFKNAMSGVQLCYELATPQSFTHEGQAVSTVVGQNNVWVDTGNVEVTYQASIKGYIDKVLGQ